MKSVANTLLCLAAVVATAGCTTMEAQIRSSGGMSQPDDTFVASAYQLSQFDMQAGKLAPNRASDPRVASLASQIMAQAGTMEPSLTAALKVEGKPAPAPSPEITAQVAQLQGLHGAAFDRQYVNDELALHKTAVTAFQREDAQTKDAAIRTRVEQELPAVQSNLDALQALSTTLPKT